MDLFHTLEDRDNPDELELNAPYKCKRADAWLGEGYYFWEACVNIAHWWGKKSYKSEGYVILKFTCDDYNNGDWRCLDLHGNTERIEMFREILNILKDKFGGYFTVSRVIEYLKKRTDFLKRFEGIRVSGINIKSQTERVSFVEGKKWYLDLYPPIQICLFRKDSLNLSTGEIIYPEKYCEGYTI